MSNYKSVTAPDGTTYSTYGELPSLEMLEKMFAGLPAESALPYGIPENLIYGGVPPKGKTGETFQIVAWDIIRVAGEEFPPIQRIRDVTPPKPEGHVPGRPEQEESSLSVDQYESPEFREYVESRLVPLAKSCGLI